MVAILVVFVILAFLTIDHLVARAELDRYQRSQAARADETASGEGPSSGPAGRRKPGKEVAG